MRYSTASFGSWRNREFGYGIESENRLRNFRQPADHLSFKEGDAYGFNLESEIKAMKNPPHPGRSIKENCLDPLGLNVTEAAKVLGVARHTLSRVLNGHAGISPEMATRLEKAGWSNAEFWLRRQTSYDLAQARRGEGRIKVERYQPQVA